MSQRYRPESEDFPRAEISEYAEAAPIVSRPGVISWPRHFFELSVQERATLLHRMHDRIRESGYGNYDPRSSRPVAWIFLVTATTSILCFLAVTWVRPFLDLRHEVHEVVLTIVGLMFLRSLIALVLYRLDERIFRACVRKIIEILRSSSD
jgi:hypothetical protein